MSEIITEEESMGWDCKHGDWSYDMEEGKKNIWKKISWEFNFTF